MSRDMVRDLFYGGLLRVLKRTNAVAGPIWAWRVTHFVHALPYWAGAWLLGYGAGWFWNAPGLGPLASAWLCSGGVVFFTCMDWLREWWRA